MLIPRPRSVDSAAIPRGRTLTLFLDDLQQAGNASQDLLAALGERWGPRCAGGLADGGKVESLTRVDRGGDPDDLVDAAEAARIWGMRTGT